MAIRLNSPSLQPLTSGYKQTNRLSSSRVEPLDDSTVLRTQKTVHTPTKPVHHKHDAFEKQFDDFQSVDHEYSSSKDVNHEPSFFNESLLAENYVKGKGSHTHFNQQGDNSGLQARQTISYSAQQALNSFENNRADIAQTYGVELIGVDTYV